VKSVFRWISVLLVVAASVGVMIIAVDAGLRVRTTTALILGIGSLLAAGFAGAVYGMWVLPRGARHHRGELAVLVIGISATTAAVDGGSSVQLVGAAAVIGFAIGCLLASLALRTGGSALGRRRRPFIRRHS
jgi:peptidoglycan/LPS O-acetylase OafA/YrhL